MRGASSTMGGAPSSGSISHGRLRPRSTGPARSFIASAAVGEVAKQRGDGLQAGEGLAAERVRRYRDAGGFLELDDEVDGIQGIHLGERAIGLQEVERAGDPAYRVDVVHATPWRVQ